MKTTGLLFLVLAVGSVVGRPETDGEAESAPAQEADEKVSYEGAQVIKLDANVAKDVLDPVLEKGGKLINYFYYVQW